MKKLIYFSPLLLLFFRKKKKGLAAMPIENDLSNKPSELNFIDKIDYIKKMLPISKVIERDYKIPYLFLLSQTALESGYGKSTLVNQAANFAGIKQPDPNKPRIFKWTFEDVKNPNNYPDRNKAKDKLLSNGYTRIYIKQPFAKYDTLSEGLAAYINVLRLPRYSKAYQYKDLFNFATEIKKGGYATGVNYVKSIVDTSKSIEKIIRDNNLK